MVAAWARHNCNGGAKKFEVVYVSSDKTEDQMLTYMQDKGCEWLAVKYAQTGVRDGLKHKYGLCGAGEVPGLRVRMADPSFERKNGLPSVIQIDTTGEGEVVRSFGECVAESEDKTKPDLGYLPGGQHIYPLDLGLDGKTLVASS